MIKTGGWLESGLFTWWAQWTGVKCGASWGICFWFFFSSLIVLCSENWQCYGFITREGVEIAHFWGLPERAAVCCAGCCGRFLRGNSQGGGGEEQGFTLSCFISYLSKPLQKPAPKTTECKGSSRGNNSAASSECYCRNKRWTTCFVGLNRRWTRDNMEKGLSAWTLWVLLVLENTIRCLKAL